MPAQPLAVLWDEPPADWPGRLAALRASSLHIWYEHLDLDILARAQAEHVQVRVFTIDDPTVVVPFREAGLTGVITNHPPAYLADPAWAKWAARP
jgi:glycerophosphoryl diester phosphodiesterase